MCPIDFEWDRSQTFAYFDAVSRGRDVRVLRLQYVTQIAGFSGPFVVTVWQDNAQRQAFVQAQVLRALGVIAALLGATAVVVWFGVRLGLKPLLDLEDAISRRSPADLSPIRRRVPDEVQGLVTRINRLFGQVSASMVAGDRVCIRPAEPKFRHLIWGEDSFFRVFRRKLGWSDVPRERQAPRD